MFPSLPFYQRDECTEIINKDLFFVVCTVNVRLFFYLKIKEIFFTSSLKPKLKFKL